MEVVRWVVVVLGGLAVLAGLCPLPGNLRRRVPCIRLILLAWGAMAMGSEARTLHWPARVQVSFSLAAGVLWAFVLVRWVLGMRRDRRG